MYCFSKCCRLCLTKNNTLVNITCSGSDGISFLDKLGLLAPSLVSNPRNNYMSWICEQCGQKLNKAYRFIQHCFKSNAVLDEFYKQLTNADSAQNKCTDSDVSDIYLTENMINESIPITIKEECLEDLLATDDKYYSENTITIDEHKLSPINFEYVKVEPSELEPEPSFNVGDDPTLNNDIIVLKCDRDQPENVQQIDPIVGTSGENNITAFSCAPSNYRSIPNRIPSNKRRHKCGICDKAFTQSSTLKRHGRIHSGERPYKCNNCNKKFARSEDLTKHETIHSGERPRPYGCKTCDKKFKYCSDLIRHERVHSGERPYECKICNVKFNDSGNLKVHERLHSGERPFKCNMCDKTFTYAGGLKQHERFHSGERPYKCKICIRQFTTSGHLQQHERFHSGERPYDCKICNKKFNTSGILKRHERIHSGERPFECKLCNKTFSQSGILKRHEAVHSRDCS